MKADEIHEAIDMLSPEELYELKDALGITRQEEILEGVKQLSPEGRETLLRRQDARERAKLWIKLVRQNGSSNA